jgi:hypothetical protein
MAKDRIVRRWAAPLALGLVVLLAVGGLTGCQPATEPLSTLYGKASHSSVPAPLATPPCPPGEVGGLPIEGVRQKWGFRIAAADPSEWLSLRPCLTFASGALTSIGDAPFTLYTASGDVTGTAAGVMESLGGDVDAYSVTLTITGGTKAYRQATGRIFLVGCRLGGRFVSSELRADVPPGATNACNRFLPF